MGPKRHPERGYSKAFTLDTLWIDRYCNSIRYPNRLARLSDALEGGLLGLIRLDFLIGLQQGIAVIT